MSPLCQSKSKLARATASDNVDAASCKLCLARYFILSLGCKSPLPCAVDYCQVQLLCLPDRSSSTSSLIAAKYSSSAFGTTQASKADKGILRRVFPSDLHASQSSMCSVLGHRSSRSPYKRRWFSTVLGCAFMEIKALRTKGRIVDKTSPRSMFFNFSLSRLSRKVDFPLCGRWQ